MKPGSDSTRLNEVFKVWRSVATKSMPNVGLNMELQKPIDGFQWSELGADYTCTEANHMVGSATSQLRCNHILCTTMPNDSHRCACSAYFESAKELSDHVDESRVSQHASL
jgi:hypothetical protein